MILYYIPSMYMEWILKTVYYISRRIGSPAIGTFNYPIPGSDFVLLYIIMCVSSFFRNHINSGLPYLYFRTGHRSYYYIGGLIANEFRQKGPNSSRVPPNNNRNSRIIIKIKRTKHILRLYVHPK